MIVNGKKYEIDDLIKTIDFNKNNLVGSGTYLLTKEEISILSRNGIDYKKYSNYKDLMFIIDEVLNDEEIDSDDADDLEYALENISERDYYANTVK